MSNESAGEGSTSELEKRVDKLEQTVKKMLPTRREALISGGLGAAALSGFGASAMADGHDDGDTQWGSDSNRDDYIVDHVDAQSIATDRVTVDTKQTMYVRSDGDDSNSGLTSSDAKATITAAIDDAPVPRSDERLAVSVGAGTFMEGRIENRKNRAYRSVLIIGDGDGLGNNNTTIDASAGTEPYAVNAAFGGHIQLANVDVIASPSVGVQAQHCGSLECTGVNLDVNGATFGAYSVASSQVILDEHCTVTNSASGSTTLVQAIGSTHLATEADITANGDEDNVILAAESARLLVDGATVNGGGGSHCIAARQKGNVEVNNCTLENATDGVVLDRDSLLNSKSNVTYNTTNEWDRDSSSVVVDDAELNGFRVTSAKEEIASGTVTISGGTTESISVTDAANGVHLDASLTILDNTEARLQSGIQWNSANGNHELWIEELNSISGDVDVGYVVWRDTPEGF